MAVYAERIVYPHTVRAIVLFIANDIAGNADDKTPEEADSLFREVIHTIRKKNAEAPVFWIAITPTALRWNVWPEIIKANNLIESSCWNYINTYFIRTDTAFLKSDGQPDEELFVPDGLHLNEKGYAVWTMIIKGALKKVLDE
jgi:lysophospholipase L1-like esterase